MLKEERYECSLLYASCEVYAHVPALGEGTEVVVGAPLRCKLMKANLLEITDCKSVLSCPSAGLNLAGKSQAENLLSVIKLSGGLKTCRKSQVAFSRSLATVFNMLLASLPGWGAGRAQGSEKLNKDQKIKTRINKEINKEQKLLIPNL